MREGFAIGYDPCHGFNFDPRSPYHNEKRAHATGDVCPLCRDHINEGEDILQHPQSSLCIHLECFEQATPQELINLLGFHQTNA